MSEEEGGLLCGSVVGGWMSVGETGGEPRYEFLRMPGDEGGVVSF